MTPVRHIRAIYGVLSMTLVCAGVLWLVHSRVWEHRDALALGATSGLLYGSLRWRRLRGRIARRDRRYAANRIFVDYLTTAELFITAVAYNVYLAVPLGVAVLAALVLLAWPPYWWAVLGSSLGLLSAGSMAVCMMRYERSRGPLYYQYKSDDWSGAEGLLYQAGTVVQPLTPRGKVKVQGVLWNAISVSGEVIGTGEPIEVITVQRLTLHVDRLPPEPAVGASKPVA